VPYRATRLPYSRVDPSHPPPLLLFSFLFPPPTPPTTFIISVILIPSSGLAHCTVPHCTKVASSEILLSRPIQSSSTSHTPPTLPIFHSRSKSFPFHIMTQEIGMSLALPYVYSEESSVPSASNSLSVDAGSPGRESRRSQSTSDDSIHISNDCCDILGQAGGQKCLSHAHESGNSLGSGGSSYRSVFGSPDSDEISPADHTSTPTRLTGCSLALRQANPIIGHCLRLPDETFICILSFLDHRSLLSARLTRKSWNDVCVEHKLLKFPSVYRLPVELVQEILSSTSPLSFNISRHVCRAWYLSALDPFLLKQHLEALGFHNSEASVRDSRNPHYLVTRLSRECSLSPDNPEGGGLRNTAILDLSELVSADAVNFTVSMCGFYALLSEGCVVYVYRLKSTQERMEYVTSVVCPRRVLAVSMDTSNQRFAIAVLLVHPLTLP